MGLQHLGEHRMSSGEYTEASHFSAESSRLSRRHLLAGAAASTAALTITGVPGALALNESSEQPEEPPYGTPEATNSISVDLDEFRSLCRQVADVSDEDLTDDSIEQLLGLLLNDTGAEQGTAAGLQELLRTDIDSLDRNSVSREANIALTQILAFLYLGEFNGTPVENRAELYPSLASYQLLPYSTTPAICKGADYWTQEVDLPTRS